MVDKLKEKLNSQKGESIGETLVALLIAALALVMLAGAISASSNAITDTKEKIDEYYESEEILAGRTGTPSSSGNVTISVTGGAGGDISFEPYPVDFYLNSEFSKTPVVEYKLR